MAYKKLIKVSNVCQVLDKSKYNPSQTINGVTFIKNDDGTFTANGTATANIDYRGVSYKSKKNVIFGNNFNRIRMIIKTLYQTVLNSNF